MSFWGLLWESFKKVKGIPGFILGIGLSVILWMLKPNAQVPLPFVVSGTLLLIILIITFADAAYQSYKARRAVLPKVIGISRQSAGIHNVEALFLLEPSELFYYGMSVSFFLTSGEFEYLVGLGYVHHIQDDGRIQVAITEIIQGHEQEVRGLISNDRTDLTMLKIKTNIPRAYMDRLQQDDFQNNQDI